MTQRSGARIVVAIDTPNVERAEALASECRSAAAVKLGLEFFAAQGPSGVRRVGQAGAPLFLDLKLHDIPNTVVGAIRALRPLAPAMLTVHAAGGSAMLASAQAATQTYEEPPALLGVTTLTSLDSDDTAAIGVHGSTSDQVVRLAMLARNAGLAGIVCAPTEAARVRREIGPDFLIVTPGIRPAAAAVQDQKRVATPSAAAAAGADLLVIGRPITGAEHPAEALAAITSELRASGR